MTGNLSTLNSSKTEFLLIGLPRQLAKTRNTSGDEIANVNFLTDDTVHTLQNTIETRIHKFRHRSTRLCVGTQV